MKRSLSIILFILAGLMMRLRAEEAAPVSVSIVAPARTSGERAVVQMPGGGFHVIVTNTSSKAVRLLNDSQSCSWGYYALSFELTGEDGKKWKAKKKQVTHSPNRPDFWVLEPGESLVLDVDFCDPKKWEGFPFFDAASSKKVKMRAVYDFQDSARDSGITERGVWTGKAVSTEREVVFRRY